MDIHKIYAYALQREYEGKRFFKTYASRLSTAAAVAAFRRLADEEQKHIEFVQAQINALDAGKTADVEMGLELDRSGVFAQRAEAEFVDQSILEAMVPDLPVLRMAYLIERDFVEFYESAAQKTDGEVRQVLETLAGWERRHAALFKQLHDQAFDEYARMPWGG